ncbi:nucleosome assembly protein 1-like 1-B isoform X2 [Venturia canescens]|uniref:nucleosome assembly protein 1-like 1-B isoform X2 n=1 Tax=Venturia canescens TaxID=32260 RepID=UPI001C9C425E|nr:nucleosome assembly protein 1-like 1-B isoform X2 [Venturia canescens]
MESVEDDDDRQTSKTSPEKYSEPVKRRIRALKQLQKITLNMEAKFYEEVHALECKYNTMCAPMYEKRSQIAAGVYEPTDEECVCDSDDEDIKQDSKTNVKIEDVTENKVESENVKGIPEFWLTIFKNVGVMAEMVEEHDEPILKHLYDIKVIFLESNPMGFVLEFHFEPNEYFSNSVLTKEYIMKCAPEKNDPFSFEGPEIYKSKGCVIDWKKGKNVTVKTIHKNQKHKSRAATRVVTKTIHNDSFFNFFSPPVVPDDADAELNDDTQRLLTSDFEIGHYIRERIVPRAIVYFTGEGLEDEDEDWDEEGDEDEDDDEDRDDDEDDDEEGSNANPRAAAGKAADCKQQ